MGQQNLPSYKQINVYLSDSQSSISLQNGFRLYFGFKTCPASNFAPLHTLYNVSELFPLLQRYVTVLSNSRRLGSIDLVLSYLVIIYSESVSFLGQVWYLIVSIPDLLSTFLLCLTEKSQVFLRLFSF